MKWPQIGERQWVTIGTFGFAMLLLGMAALNPALWEVEVFKVIIQAVVLTGLLNMVLAFHFASNKGSETARENTGKAFDAITAAASANNNPPNAQPGGDPAAQAADTVAGAAVGAAEAIKGHGQ